MKLLNPNNSPTHNITPEGWMGFVIKFTLGIIFSGLSAWGLWVTNSIQKQDTLQNTNKERLSVIEGKLDIVINLLKK